MSAHADDKLINFGLLATKDVEPGVPATIIVVGLPRSGTSMIAAVLKTLGVHIGTEIDGAVFEDRQFAAALASGQSEGLARLIEERNAAHTNWGFKRPEAYRQLSVLVPLCRNARVIVTFRDILAISLRNRLAMQMDPLKLLPRLAGEYSELCSAIRSLPVPSLLISYEKALQFPVQTVEEIARFCGLQPDSEAVLRSVRVIENGNSRYIEAARLQYHGYIGRLVDGRLRGWVKAISRDDIRVNVELRLDGRLVQTTRANLYRPDVERAGHGDGRYGFEFPIDSRASGHSLVQVNVENSDICLKNGGLPLIHYGSPQADHASQPESRGRRRPAALTHNRTE